MKRVILESPYRGAVQRHLEYARACLRDCLERGESPLASHLLYTQDGVLDDNTEKERIIGIGAMWAWFPCAEKMVVYTDCGISDGMRLSIAQAKSVNLEIEYRMIFGGNVQYGEGKCQIGTTNAENCMQQASGKSEN